MSNPVTSPVSAERNITIASDALNFQMKKESSTGIAFWTENIATNTMIIRTTAM
jgi:hypothetical protein